MGNKRKSADVICSLLRSMDEMVVHYHPTVTRTSTTVDGLIQGTAAFPGGAGLWRGQMNNGAMPEWFPESPVMFVGHNFDSVRGDEISHAQGGEVGGQFWRRLLLILEAARINPDACFFTNALMGLKPGKATGAMPSIPGYKEQCERFLQRQVEIVQPSVVVAVGAQAIKYVGRLKATQVTLRHPGDWAFRNLAERDALIAAEGKRLSEAIAQAGIERIIYQTPPDADVKRRANEGERMERMNGKHARGVDDWGFRLGTRGSFLMEALESGGKGKEQIKIEFLQRFPGSTDKSTFGVFFSDLIRPFGSASVSRCIRIESDEHGHLRLEPERARQIKAAIAAGILKEINAIPGIPPKKDQSAIDSIVEKFGVPRA